MCLGPKPLPSSWIWHTDADADADEETDSDSDSDSELSCMTASKHCDTHPGHSWETKNFAGFYDTRYAHDSKSKKSEILNMHSWSRISF